MSTAYPGRIIKPGESDRRVVRALKQQLNLALAQKKGDPSWLDPRDPNFGPETRRVVKLFQARNVDDAGRPLSQDGQVGSLTWAALFHDAPARVDDVVADPLFAAALRVAASEEAAHVREEPRNSNRGPRVEQYLSRVAVPPGNAWCCAFVYWCVDEAAQSRGSANPLVKTGGCLDHWNRAPAKGATRIPSKDAVNDPSLVKPGMIFIIDHGGGLGHTGLVERVAGGLLTTIEGNTDASRTREGGGVYRLTRKVAEINKGYLRYV